MKRDPRYDVLFEPVQIGPVTAPNRFFQAPHCTGISDSAPKAITRMREIKAEGGWGVVCTEIAEVSHDTEFWPFPSLHLWRDEHVGQIAKIPNAIHRHGALAGVELGHVGLAAGNRGIRIPPLGPSSALTLESVEPFQCKAMDKADIKTFRHQHRAAARRARDAGFDIVYVYASHGLSLLSQFMQTRYNKRTDEYGGCFENRIRLLREVLEDMKDEIGTDCAVAIRFAVNEVTGKDGTGRDVVEALAELPDLWDVNLSDWTEDSATSRFAKEGYQEDAVRFVKALTTKPVVSVGRFTSPDSMVQQINKGVCDLIGAARPSIADPFLPKKIQEGRVDAIRECIGCNICVTGELSYSPVRCTQNPTFLEESRRGWHPETVAPKGSDDGVLIVGGGPSGLEAALILAKRGYDVTLAEARDTLGGRVTREASLPGLSEWARVRDWRLHQLRQMANVNLYTSSDLSADDVLSFHQPRVAIATGALWRKDGVGRYNASAVPGWDAAHVVTPDDVFDGIKVQCPVLIYDEDGTYLGNLFAEKFASEGLNVTLATPASEVAPYLALTMEQHKVVPVLMEFGVRLERLKQLVSIDETSARLTCVHGGEAICIDAGTIVMLTSRTPKDQLFQDLTSRRSEWSEHQVTSVDRLGDCEAPNIIAAAVHAGHRYATALDTKQPNIPDYLPERP